MTELNSVLERYNPEPFYTPTGDILAVRFDVTTLLEEHIGRDWQTIITGAIENEGLLVVRDGQHESTTEADPEDRFGLITLRGDILARRASGLWRLHRTTFADMMRYALPDDAEDFSTYEDPLNALECVSQEHADPGSGMKKRMEAHIDFRYTAVQVVEATDSDEEGGRLVIANNPEARSVSEIDVDATYITHVLGTLVCFSQGGRFAHYTEEITKGKRTVVAHNYRRASETDEQTESLTANILINKG